MADAASQNAEAVDVAVIGGGPSGLAAAVAVRDAGVQKVVVFEREPKAGGIPRHCSHPPFGVREFQRILTGPRYAARLVAQAESKGVDIRTLTTVTEISAGAELQVTSPDGTSRITARRVIYATGTRETPRSARLISGARVQGVVNTGALQSMVYLKQRRPFTRPVIIGSELVAFSAIMTCRHAGIRPVAMIEPRPTTTARWPSALYPLLRGVKLLTGTQLSEIRGDGRVKEVTVIRADGRQDTIPCDGVILAGCFTPEAALARCGHLEVDAGTGGPIVDQWGRCSDPAYFATGNLLRSVETAGRCWAEGRLTGLWVARDLAGELPQIANPVRVGVRDKRLKYAMPQLVCPDDVAGMQDIQLRVTEPVSGRLVAHSAKKPIWQRWLKSKPERRIGVPIADILSKGIEGRVEFSIEDPGE